MVGQAVLAETLVCDAARLFLDQRIAIKANFKQSIIAVKKILVEINHFLSWYFKLMW